jgi:phosphatidylserine decarboxylase
MSAPADAASPLARLFLQEDLNFLVTNRLPRRYATLLMGWFARIESRALARASLAVWRLFADDLQLEESATTDFRSLRDVFVRELREGARPIAPDPLVAVSPCDAEIGAFGTIRDGQVFQAKGFPYSLLDLVGDASLATRYRDGRFVTLRLKANMYHRFHAPLDGHIRRVLYMSGDTWNVNPIALRRVERLFCRNERAVIELDPGIDGSSLTLVPIAAILVASIRLHCVPEPLTLKYRGPNEFSCDARVARGQELGWFESGSTIVVLTSDHFEPCENVVEGAIVRMGQPLLRRRSVSPTTPGGQP